MHHSKVAIVILLVSVVLSTGCSSVTRQRQSNPIPSGFIARAMYIDGSQGWIGGDGGILYTPNSGRSWLRTVSRTVTGAFILSRNAAWAYGPEGLEFTSTQGAHWKELSAMSFTAVDFINRHIGYAQVRHAETTQDLYRTVNGGASWRRVSPIKLSSVCFWNIRGGWGMANDENSIMRTQTGGHFWRTALDVGPLESEPGQLQCSGTFGWAVLFGGAGMGQISYSVFKLTASKWVAVAASSTAGGGSAPGGSARTARAPAVIVRGLQAVSVDQLFLLGYTGTSLVLASTDNGGQEWRVHRIVTTLDGSPVGAAMYIASARVYFVVVSKRQGEATVSWSRDGGKTWRTSRVGSSRAQSWNPIRYVSSWDGDGPYGIGQVAKDLPLGPLSQQLPGAPRKSG